MYVWLKGMVQGVCMVGQTQMQVYERAQTGIGLFGSI